MKEIGGYLELERFNGSEYHEKALRFNTVRNSIEYILTIRKYKKIYIPYYMCDSIRNMLEKIGFSYEYYRINMHLEPIIKKDISNTDVILIVNYFGAFDNDTIRQICKNYSNIILDNTHAFFQEPIKGVDTVYNCRKFFGVADGAYLYVEGDASAYEKLPYDYSTERMEHVLGRYELSAEKYFKKFQDSDNSLDNQSIKKMSRLTQNLLKGIDYYTALKKRKNNSDILDQELDIINKFPLNTIGTYMYPLLVDDGSDVRKKLIKKKIFIPTLWPNVLMECSRDSWEYYLANNLLPLPIDQRYSNEEMHYVVSVIKEITKSKGERK